MAPSRSLQTQVGSAPLAEAGRDKEAQWNGQRSVRTFHIFVSAVALASRRARTYARTHARTHTCLRGVGLHTQAPH